MIILNRSGLAASGLVGFTCMTKSLQMISPSLVTSLRSLELVMAFIVQTIITGEKADLVSSLGGGLIVTGEPSCDQRKILNHLSSGVLMVAFQATLLNLLKRIWPFSPIGQE